MTRLFLVLLVVPACNLADSDTVPMSELQADITVVADGSGTADVYAWLWNHPDGAPPLNEDSIQLVDGDQLTATSAGDSVAMQEAYLVAEYRYAASFATAAPGQSFTTVLDRASGDSASSTVTLPDPFDLTAPATTSRAQPLTITWTPSGSSDAIALQFDGCGDAKLGPLADTGSATLDANALSSTTEACQLSLTMTRTRTGSLDQAYGQGGSITAAQQRTTVIATTP